MLNIVDIGANLTHDSFDRDRADVLAMIKQGADVNAPQGDGVTALHLAARHGDADLVTALVAVGQSLPFRRGGSVSLPLDVSRTL